jgi:hypothetical protein
MNESSKKITWPELWTVPFNRKQLLITFTLLIIMIAAIIPSFTYFETRQGFVIERGWLDAFIPPMQLSLLIFICTYTGIVVGIFSVASSAALMHQVLRTYIVLQLLRVIMLWIVPLDVPPGFLPLNDPVLTSTFYSGRENTKDLFFSGHTATLLMFAFFTTKRGLRMFFVLLATAVGVFVIVQRVHYIVDVVAAPFFTWMSVRIARLLPALRASETTTS